MTAVGLSLLMLPPLLLWWRKLVRLADARFRLEDKILEIVEEYPEAVRAWGGEAVLDNMATVRELERALGANGPTP